MYMYFIVINNVSEEETISKSLTIDIHVLSDFSDIIWIYVVTDYSKHSYPVILICNWLWTIIMTLGRHSPVNLFQTCINLVAQNLDHVESFFGFPALIGEKIFMVAMETQRMKSNIQYITQALQLFVDAFEEEVLSSLNLSGKNECDIVNCTCQLEFHLNP